MEVTPDKRLVAAAGMPVINCVKLVLLILRALLFPVAYQQIRMFDVNSSDPSPVRRREGGRRRRRMDKFVCICSSAVFFLWKKKQR